MYTLHVDYDIRIPTEKNDPRHVIKDHENIPKKDAGVNKWADKSTGINIFAP